MLRVAFLPSDFNPMILMLGEAEDLRALAGVLRQFARTGGTLRLDELAFCTAPRTRLTLVATESGGGVESVASEAGHYVWRLPPSQAAEFAAAVEDLALPSRVAGSELWDAGTHDGITVKVSRGEYTDDYLLEASCS